MVVAPYRIPTAAEREVLFSWLKRASSWTGWNLLLERHKRFSAIVETAFKDDQINPRPDGKNLIPQQWVSTVFSSEAAFEAALKRLRAGDRSCFLFLGASGHFSQGLLAVRWWRDMNFREIYMSGPEFTPNQSQFWPQIEKAIDDVVDVSSELGCVLQTRHTDVPAPLEDLDDYKPEMWACLVQKTPIDPVLRKVPDPPEPAVIIKTGRTIPDYGVWEPVKKMAKDAYVVDGLMNYLHGGQAAPTIGFAGDGQRHEGRATLWRLIWPDRRYGSKTIPDEEKTYQFGGWPPP